MAKKRKRDDDLFTRLRAGGVRKKLAGVIAETSGRGSRKAPKPARDAVAQLRNLVGELEDRVHGGPGKRKAAARKAARTRKRKANRRSAAAKKGARTGTRA